MDDDIATTVEQHKSELEAAQWKFDFEISKMQADAEAENQKCETEIAGVASNILQSMDDHIATMRKQHMSEQAALQREFNADISKMQADADAAGQRHQAELAEIARQQYYAESAAPQNGFAPWRRSAGSAEHGQSP